MKIHGPVTAMGISRVIRRHQEHVFRDVVEYHRDNSTRNPAWRKRGNAETGNIGGRGEKMRSDIEIRG